MTLVLGFMAVMALGLVLSERLAGPLLRAYDAWREWNHVQDERERLHALRVASGHAPRCLP